MIGTSGSGSIGTAERCVPRSDYVPCIFCTGRSWPALAFGAESGLGLAGVEPPPPWRRVGRVMGLPDREPQFGT